MVRGCPANLEWFFLRADKVDYEEGQLAYMRYHQLMVAIAAKYQQPFNRVVAAFVTLSPNNDYSGNLRSLITLLDGVREGRPVTAITTSTYRHCLIRAHAYLTGAQVFEQMVKGRKIINFYHNILSPADHRWITIDGHMSAAWQGRELTMKQAILKGRREYEEIAFAVKQLAFKECLLPNQYQAIVWFTRKRMLKVRYNPQPDLLDWARGDVWRTLHNVDEIRPFV